MAPLDPILTSGDGSRGAVTLAESGSPPGSRRRSGLGGRALQRAQKSGRQRSSSSENATDWLLGGSSEEQISTQPRRKHGNRQSCLEPEAVLWA